MPGSEGVRYRRPRGQIAGIRVFVDLATAHSDFEISYEGSAVIVERLDGQLSVKLDRPNGDAVNLRLLPGLAAVFSRLYLTNIAQPAKKAVLFLLAPGVKVCGSPGVGALSAYLAPTSLGAGASSTIIDPTTSNSVKLKRYSISTDTATQLDLMWASTPFESFNLSGPGSVLANLIGSELTGPQGAVLAVKTSVAAKVTAHASYELV